KFFDEYMEVEIQNNNLANLYVASYRLHGSVERKEVISAIREIIINLIGCEEFGIFEIGGASPDLKLISAMGIDAYDHKLLSRDSAVIRGAMEARESFVARLPNGEGKIEGLPPVTACIPLVLNEDVIGAIVLFRLLPQKAGLLDSDHELFNLLGTQAATA